MTVPTLRYYWVSVIGGPNALQGSNKMHGLFPLIIMKTILIVFTVFFQFVMKNTAIKQTNKIS